MSMQPLSTDGAGPQRRIRVVNFRRTCAITGGPERLLVSLAKYIDRSAFDLTMVDIGLNEEYRTPFLREVEEYGIATASVPAASKFDVLRSIRYLADLLKELDADVLHTHDHRTDFLGYFATRRSGTPITVSVWQPLRRYWWLKHVEILDEHLIRRFDRILPCASAVRQEILSKRPDLAERVDLIPGGVDLDGLERPARARADVRRELDLTDGDFVCVFAGRIMEDKGLPYLVEAHRRIRDAGVNVVQLIIGEGPQQEEIEQRVKSAGLQDRLRFLPYRTDLPDVLAACDLLVHPSLSEGLSISIITAMAAGLAVVATNVGGTSESVLHNDSGMVVEPRDPEALARCVMELVADPARRLAMAARSRELAFSRWSVERMVRDFERVYRKMAEDRRKTGKRQT